MKDLTDPNLSSVNLNTNFNKFCLRSFKEYNPKFPVWTDDKPDFLTLSAQELLMSYCPLVERLGFDENFMDVTEMVERRLKETRISDLSFNGHIYKHESELERHLK